MDLLGHTHPPCVAQQPLHSKKFTAWVALSKHGIIGPFFFEDERRNVMTDKGAVCEDHGTILGRAGEM